ncbi:2'-deoxynucleoside 5'-phosphate N-hydrolase 1 [Apilactobacillus kunkeei]|uniref:nucleoside 2-deoxyribosyltransferase n=1 Tax=Apilactobacillus TaxID=2767877 RepID=UPI001C6F63A6|nr:MULTISPECIES: nucleoside 2-deoxyribosyltransferase [Apilactobacillus]MBX8454984.1 nucleoside 2-deoxyribosyltransferase [Apilactobacillus kunkeei]MDN2613250.1 nucleoside 2-deoxyribosyltransferase [Apilactobacillus sp. EABW-1NA]QYU54526.1 nucleoside 2-deoxyribosyltransferase [Apilactobacillus kunkeei]CAI2552723.1 2'-deoxynucleoside 5'-phosphate N-hydrolase 1 [Apilactobacillus kunkeei]CAI2553119.1 2'-deoxynucleoside 5'-phosphate N-hydrolase 1 [Apilactobacillus kunkeei]
MKIYFAGSIRGGREDVSVYNNIIKYLKTKGDVLTEHVGDYSLSIKGQNQLSNSYIRNRDIRWLKSSDILVAETSVSSIGVGYELSYAEKFNIPVIILHNDSKSQLSAMIEGTEYFNNIYHYKNINEALSYLEKKVF